ncbi:MAG TPA: DUF3103 family protein, partial [Thermoanaerobaculia bacterium]|nr:DUF3103 family protein [Thermoanaerobaculia bacterium]
MQRALTLCAILFFFAGSALAAGPRPGIETPALDLSIDAVSQPSPFAHFARALASAMADPELRATVHREVGRQFDGDFNVLYNDLANQRLSDGTTVRTRIARGDLSGETAPGRVTAALSTLDGYARALPRLQVAVPVHFDDWDPATFAPLVAFMPTDVDDDELYEIEAYDAEGNLHRLDAQLAPNEPVIVVSLNERTDDNGFLLTDDAGLTLLTGA